MKMRSIKEMIITNEISNLKLSFGKRNSKFGKMYDYRSNAIESIRIIRQWKNK
jgi:hypothetical protein